MFWNGDIQNFSNRPRFDGYFNGIRDVARRTLPRNPPREWIALFDKNIAQEERAKELALVPSNLEALGLETSFSPRDLHLDLPLSTRSTFIPDWQPPALSARQRLHHGNDEDAGSKSKCSKFQITLIAVAIYLAIAVLVMMITVAILISTMNDIKDNGSPSASAQVSSELKESSKSVPTLETTIIPENQNIGNAAGTMSPVVTRRPTTTTTTSTTTTTMSPTTTKLTTSTATPITPSTTTTTTTTKTTAKPTTTTKSTSTSTTQRTTTLPTTTTTIPVTTKMKTSTLQTTTVTTPRTTSKATRTTTRTTPTTTTTTTPTTTTTTTPTTTITIPTTTTSTTTPTTTTSTTTTPTTTTTTPTTTTNVPTTTTKSTSRVTTTTPTPGPPAPVCNTSFCRVLGDKINASLNDFVNPCDNFYLYACGRWRTTRSNLLQEGAVESFRTNAQADKLFNFLVKIRGILEVPIQANDSSMAVKQIYQNCLTSNNKYDALKVFQDIHVLLDPLGMTSSLTTDKTVEDLQYVAMSEFGTGPLFSFSVESTMIDRNKKYITKLRAPELLLARSIYDVPIAESVEALDYFHQVSRIMEQFFISNRQDGDLRRKRRKKRSSSVDEDKYWFKTRRLLQEEEEGAGVYGVAINMMNKVFSFEKELAKIVPVSVNEASINIQTVQRVKISEMMTAYPYLNWTKMLNSTDSSQLVELVEPEYFQALNALLNKTNVNTIKFFIFTRIILKGIWKYLPLFNRNSINGLGGYVANFYTWTDCINFTLNLLPFDIHLDYLLTYYTEINNNKNYLISMLQNMSLIIQENLSSFTMLSSETIGKIKARMQQVNMIFVPVPSSRRTILSVPSDEDSFLLAAHSAMMSKFRRDQLKVGLHVYFTHIDWQDMYLRYDHDTNVIGIPIGVTNNVVNKIPGFNVYSTTGFQAATELFKIAFGKMVDYYSQGWWSGSTSGSYYDKWTCYFGQNKEDQTVEGMYRTGQTISTLIAFEKSYLMFRQLVIKNLTEEFRLPNINLDKNQLYYINFAQDFCETDNRKVMLTAEKRINWALRNDDGFGSVYKCPSGSYMNPKTKCKL